MVYITKAYIRKSVQVFVYFSSLNIKYNAPNLEFSNEEELNNWLLQLIPNKKTEDVDKNILNFVNTLPVYSIIDPETVYSEFIIKNPEYMNATFNSIFDKMKNDSIYGYFVINNPQLFPDNIKNHIMKNTFNIIDNYTLLMSVPAINNYSNGEPGFTEYLCNMNM